VSAERAVGTEHGPGRAATHAPPLIEAHHLTIGYDGTPALSEVSFAVEPGERVGVIGPNGGGKTTLFRAVLGELQPLNGSIDVRGRCGVVPQTQRSRLDFPVTALDVALMGSLSRLPWWRRPGRSERRRALHALRLVGLQDQANRSFGELSGGQQQRVLVARALVQDAQILLLDEPFTGVDQPSADLMMELLERLAHRDVAMLIATHEIEQVQGWEKVLCLNRRQIAFGAPDTVLTRQVLDETYPGAMPVMPHHGHEPGG
jgi:ABC-type Mn2+/Zn2+ transport system ATPase subunit